MNIPTIPIPIPTERQFLVFRYNIDDECKSEDDCWEWMGTRNKKGYGLSRSGHKHCQAHRLSFRLAYNFDPVGFLVGHTCDNPACCNPKHLFKTTPKGNSQDMYQKGRSTFGTRNTHAILTESQVVQIRKLHSLGESQSSIARKYGVCQSMISLIVRRKNWKRAELDVDNQANSVPV